MMKWETKLRKWLTDHILLLAYVAVGLLGLFLRFSYFPHLSEDLSVYNVPWLRIIQEKGAAGVFSDGIFFNYSPLHLYLWTGVAKLTVGMEPLFVLKCVTFLFDVLLCFACWRLVCHLLGKNSSANKRFMAFTLLWLHPTLIWNAAAWGQTDAIYAVFCIWSVLLLLKDKPVWALLTFAVAFSFKMQALFLFPLFLFVYFSKRKAFSGLWFACIPLMLLLTGLPMWAIGQSPLYAFQNYMGQIDIYTYMTYNYPNLFAVVGDIHNQSQMTVGMHSRAGFVACITVLGCMLVLFVRKGQTLRDPLLLRLAAFCVWCCLFFLPRMHERYGLVGEMLLICTALLSAKPRDYLCAALNMLAVLSAYASYLFQSEFFSLQLGGVLNLIAFVLFTYSIVAELKKAPAALDHTDPSILEGGTGE